MCVWVGTIAIVDLSRAIKELQISLFTLEIIQSQQELQQSKPAHQNSPFQKYQSPVHHTHRIVHGVAHQHMEQGLLLDPIPFPVHNVVPERPQHVQINLSYVR